MSKMNEMSENAKMVSQEELENVTGGKKKTGLKHAKDVLNLDKKIKQKGLW